MELCQASVKSLRPDTLQEINDRLRRRYLDRLNHKVKRLRKLLVERNWEELRAECTHLASSGENFGFPDLTDSAMMAQNAIPAGKVPRPATPAHAKQSTEALISAIDSILIEHTLPRA